MSISVYLHDYVIQFYKMINPDVSVAVNRVLDKLLEEGYDLSSIPVQQSRDKSCKRLNLEITSRPYLKMSKLYEYNKCPLSLRRIIYWFLDSGIYEQVDIEYDNLDGNYEKNQFCNLLNKSLSSLNKAVSYTRNGTLPDYEDRLLSLIDTIQQIKEELLQ